MGIAALHGMLLLVLVMRFPRQRWHGLLTALLLAALLPPDSDAKSYGSGSGRSYSSSSSSRSSSAGSSRSFSSGGSRNSSSSSRTTSSSSGSRSSSGGSHASKSTGGGASRSSATVATPPRTTSTSSSAARSQTSESTSRSFTPSSGRSYSSSSPGSDDSRRSYTSGRSYSSGTEQSFRSNFDRPRQHSPSSLPSASATPDSSFNTFDSAAARAQKEEASRREYARFKEAQRPVASPARSSVPPAVTETRSAPIEPTVTVSAPATRATSSQTPPPVPAPGMGTTTSSSRSAGSSPVVILPIPGYRPSAAPAPAASVTVSSTDAVPASVTNIASSPDVQAAEPVQPPESAPSYRVKPPPLPLSATGQRQRAAYVPDRTALSTRAERADSVFQPYASRPLITFRDPYSSLFWWWLLDRSLDERAAWGYHHRTQMDPARYEALVAGDQQIEARIQELEAQQVPRNPEYTPAGVDRDLMFSDRHVMRAYSNRPTVGGSVAFWVLAIPTALGVICLLVWLVFIKRWQVAN